MGSLTKIYRLMAEHVPPGATAMVGSWEEAERYWKGSSAAWDVADGEEWLGGHDIELFQVGALLLAGRTGDDSHKLFVNGEWADLGDTLLQPQRAWLKVIGHTITVKRTDGSERDVESAIYIPTGRRITFLHVMGPDPEEIPGFSKPVKPNGYITAELRGPVTAEDVRRAVLAITKERH